MVKLNSRMDALSRKPFPKSELFRLVYEDDRLVLDLTNNKPGRGFYLHRSEDSILLARKKGFLEKKNHGNPADHLYEEMKNAL